MGYERNKQRQRERPTGLKTVGLRLHWWSIVMISTVYLTPIILLWLHWRVNRAVIIFKARGHVDLFIRAT